MIIILTFYKKGSKTATHAVIEPFIFLCGKGEIRTPGTIARTTVFETAAFDHSATFPCVVWAKIAVWTKPF